MKTSYIVLFCFVECCVGVLLTHHTDCGSHGTVHSIYLGPCEHEPCHITAGQTYNATINFTASESSQSATNECQGEIAGSWELFPVKPADACGNGVTCPIVKGQTYTYTASVTCPADVVSMRLVGKWMVKDDMNRNIICFAFPLVIKGN